MIVPRHRSVRAVTAALIPVVLAGCSVASVATPDPAAVPDGTLEAAAADATGPIVAVGSGQNAGLGWRYSIYPSGDEWCTQLEFVEFAAAGCGDLLPADGDAFGSVGRGEVLGEGVTPIEGIVSGETVTVSLVNEAGFRMPAQLMSLEEAGLEEQAFIAFVPPDVTFTHVQALASSGEILETHELPAQP